MSKEIAGQSQVNITPEKDKCVKRFTDNITKYGAIAADPLRNKDFDINVAMKDCENDLIALNAKGGLQTMLITQMIAIHNLQQVTISLANKSNYPESRQSHINSAIKLANCFTQQTALLAKLQGVGGQKIVVEHVEVHQGGQAVVGNISGNTPSDKEKK